MSVRAQRRFNLMVGSLAWIAGLVAMGGAVYTAMHPSVEAPAPVAMRQEIDTASCQVALDALGYYVRVENGTKLIAQDVAFNAETSSVADQFVRASLAIEACRLPLTEFCAGSCNGTGLPASGLRFTLALPGGTPGAQPAVAGEPGKPGSPAAAAKN
jgi:hypothetical protein